MGRQHHQLTSSSTVPCLLRDSHIWNGLTKILFGIIRKINLWIHLWIILLFAEVLVLAAVSIFDVCSGVYCLSSELNAVWPFTTRCQCITISQGWVDFPTKRPHSECKSWVKKNICCTAAYESDILIPDVWVVMLFSLGLWRR